ncbi:Imm49 family immunity protein [Streptomyces monticola]|uniref:Imm49 family immunity protein n=1 Tax=Streptomyces monticola TaxID=2666263 RepID=A0ABW2JNF2_9ACTN
MTGYEWWMLCEEFLDYLGALSVEIPDLNTPEAKAVVHDAAEAAVGKVAFATYFPSNYFQVFLDYVNFGMTYDAGSEGERETITAGDWLDAFCLVILDGRAEWHGEAFYFAGQKAQKGAATSPAAAELINGLMAYVLGYIGDDDAEHPPSLEDKLGAVDAALDRVRVLESELNEGLLKRREYMALRALRALTAGDEETFTAQLVQLLTAYSRIDWPGAETHTLLPLLPLALAALAYRREGWEPAIQTDYLPRALVTGFETPGPRVRAYGRERRRDAVAELSDGPVVFERPENPRPLNPESEAILQRDAQEILRTADEKPASAADLADAMHDQELLFKFRATCTADVTDRQLENLSLASRFGAAAFRSARAEAEYDRHHTGAGRWLTATNFALISGVREELAALVLVDAAILADGSAFASYYQALHVYLRAEDAGPATDRALEDFEKAKGWGFFPPPAVLFSQLVEGDAESFNLALLDALEAHRDRYRIADRADDPDAAVNLDILALACHARRRGFAINVTSPYLPLRLLEAAKPL